LRFRVLFEVWAPGVDRLTVRYVLCQGCGLVISAPRPTANEVSAKYAFLGGATSSTVANPVVMPVDRRRSTEILELVSPFLTARARVLDFGGGTGSLMTSFMAQGCECAVIDYAPETIPGVERIGETLDALPADRRFDLIIASHVIEHVTDPVATVRSLADHLAADGLIYLAVPLELAGRAPRRSDPVTHINFFAEPSVRELLRRTGLVTVTCRTEATTHSGGPRELAVRAIAKLGGDDGLRPRDPVSNAADEVRRLIRLSPAGRAAFLLRYPGRVWNPLRRLCAKRGW
jgi:SAM-dependent methyltransferase